MTTVFVSLPPRHCSAEHSVILSVSVQAGVTNAADLAYCFL